MGNTFINSSDYQGRLKETTQCGAELIGDSTVAADAEIIALTVASLLEVGLKQFQISVGHSKFFAGLIEAAGIDEEQEAMLRDLISNKNFFGVEEFIETLNLNDELNKLFMMLGNFDSKEEEISEAKALAESYPVIKEAITELEDLSAYLKMYEIDKYVTIELGIISDYKYYTGIIFSGYTFGTGEPIVKGGRYDSLLKRFGKDAPAIGFAIVVDQLMAAISRQNIQLGISDNSAMVVYDKDCAKEAISRAMALRKQGVNVELLQASDSHTKDDYAAYAVKMRINKVEFINGEK